jgi:hypothetical protein
VLILRPALRQRVPLGCWVGAFVSPHRFPAPADAADACQSRAQSHRAHRE